MLTSHQYGLKCCYAPLVATPDETLHRFLVPSVLRGRMKNRFLVFLQVE